MLKPPAVARRHRAILFAVSITAIITLLLLAPRFVTPTSSAVVSSTVDISQIYGGGGNSGSTYKNDFIEIFNRGTTAVNLAGYSVQYASSTGTTWQVTNLTGTIQPGGYFLVQEAAGTGGTTNLPASDATGTINMSATTGKVALTNSTTALSGACPTDASIIDLIGYGAANCSETSPTAALTNTTAAIRKNGGCTDTDNNSSDFVVSGGPTPRNSASSTNVCSVSAGSLSASGAASPSSLDPGSNTLLKVTVTPGTTPTSTGISVTGNLTNIGGAASQIFYDDGTHGDAIAGDNIFSFLATVAGNTPTGGQTIPVSVTDAQSRTASTSILLTIQSPTCGVERWTVKTGTDPDAGQVNLAVATPITIADLRSYPAPSPTPPDNARVMPYEDKVYVINGTLNVYKKETDVDYHIVVQDGAGNTVITEIPLPGCVGPSSPFASMIATARSTFDARLTATTSFQTANIPIRVKGVGFFDFLHGQTGVAPNGIELHPILDIIFPTAQSAATTTGSNVTVTAGDATITFTNVTAPGTTTVTPIDPSSAGTPPPGGYSLTGPGYDISTTATVVGPINVCFTVPSVTDSVAFSKFKLLHNEGGILVDHTTGVNFSSKTVCGTVLSLSPFDVAVGPGTTAARASITGKATTPDGTPLEGVTMTLSGAKQYKAITDANGNYSFADVDTGSFYAVTPSRANYTFSPRTRAFSIVGNQTDAIFTATPDGMAKVNPLDTTEYFVRQQYLDFLGREPDQSGFNYWSNQIGQCLADSGCMDNRRTSTSAAFFLSTEFQQTGYLVHRLYQSAYGRAPSFTEFAPDARTVGSGVVVLANNWEQQLEMNKQAFLNEFVNRAAFKSQYPETLSAAQFVDALNANTNNALTKDERDALVGDLSSGAQARSQVLRRVAENAAFTKAEFNRAFVEMQYFGYLRRNPDADGFKFWLEKLNRFSGDYNAAEMVRSFVVAEEYRGRFAPPQQMSKVSLSKKETTQSERRK